MTDEPEVFTKQESEEIQAILTRISDRRLGYLYQGFTNVKGQFLVGNFIEEDFQFGQAELTCGVLTIKSQKHLSLLTKFFKCFDLNIFDKTLRVIHLRELISIANALKWKIDKSFNPYIDKKTHSCTCVSATGKSLKIIWSPIDTYFTYIRLREQADVLVKGVYSPTSAMLNFNVEKYQKYTLVKMYLDENTFKNTALSKIITHPLKFTISKGYELLTPTKVIPKGCNDYIFGLKIWSPSEQTDICYGGYYEDPRFSILSGRLNVFLLGNLSYERYRKDIERLKSKEKDTSNVS
jgi:hypothetical protein